MKKIINYVRFGLLSLGLIAAVGGVAVLPQTALASPADEIGKGVPDNDGKKLEVYIKEIVNTLLFLVGAIAVIVIVIGGLKYVTSDGDAGKIKSAKDTILYAVVGIIIAILAYAIVNFVIDQF